MQAGCPFKLTAKQAWLRACRWAQGVRRGRVYLGPATICTLLLPGSGSAQDACQQGVIEAVDAGGGGGGGGSG